MTNDVIRLCKRIAKKHRKDLKVGMYVWREFDKTVQLIYRLDKKEKDIYTAIPETGKLEKHYWNNLEGEWLTPLWTIPECLKFLGEKFCSIERQHVGLVGDGRIAWICVLRVRKKNTKYLRLTRIHYIGKIPLEACLEAVLAVVKEGE